jgi:hypothetical protein
MEGAWLWILSSFRILSHISPNPIVSPPVCSPICAVVTNMNNLTFPEHSHSTVLRIRVHSPAVTLKIWPHTIFLFLSLSIHRFMQAFKFL